MSEPSSTEPLRIVSIGGGSGLSTLLRGLKRYAKANENLLEITAVVTVTDDGGSSGRLRRDFEVLPPGDIRSCMVALSEDEKLLTQLFQYRFSGGRGLKGHSFGNLFLTAMTHLTGDFGQAVKLSSEVLAVAGRIYPSTAANVTLEATLANGRKLKGETRISKSTSPIQKIRMLPQGAKPLPETLDALAKADLITLGPGSLFTSIVPNLLVDGIPRAIASSRALKVYFVNLMSQPGETTDYGASDHVTALLRHCSRLPGPLIDLCVVNSRPLSRPLVAKYRKQEAQPVDLDTDRLLGMGMKVLAADLIRAGGPLKGKIRHDEGAIGAVAIELAREGRWGRLRRAS